MVKLEYYETETGYLMRMMANDRPQPMAGMLVNGSPVERTHAPDWYSVICRHGVVSVEGVERRSSVVVGYKKKSDATGLPLPEKITSDNIPEGFDTIRDAYEPVYSEVVHPRQQTEIEPSFRGKVSWESLRPDKFKFSLGKDDSGMLSRRNQEEQFLTIEDLFMQYEWAKPSIQADDIQRAMTPNFAWHLAPCSIGSHTMYRIIRASIKERLDGRYATITSDHDFVFEVKKKLPCTPKEVGYSNPFARTKKGRSKVSYRLEKDRLIKVLHFTHQDRVHGLEYGAKVVEGVMGENLADLGRKINERLCELIALVNSPVRICPNCDGSGITDIVAPGTPEARGGNR
jgi:hypothetical protein